MKKTFSILKRPNSIELPLKKSILGNYFHINHRKFLDRVYTHWITHYLVRNFFLRAFLRFLGLFQKCCFFNILGLELGPKMVKKWSKKGSKKCLKIGWWVVRHPQKRDFSTFLTFLWFFYFFINYFLFFLLFYYFTNFYRNLLVFLRTKKWSKMTIFGLFFEGFKMGCFWGSGQ